MKVNTELCINLKTKLQNEVLMKPGKEYPGIMRRDTPSEEFGFDDCHYTFTEALLSSSTGRRNVCIYEGQHITCTKRLNGTVRLNFKNLKVDAEFNVDGYALEVANEIREALKGLVEEE